MLKIRIAPITVITIFFCGITLMFGFGILVLFPQPVNAAGKKLYLHRVLPIEGPENIQPSGLVYCQGRLLTVSDKHDDVVFAIEIYTTKAVLRPYVRFCPPVRPLDLEGITCTPDGLLYLASESTNRMIRVDPATGTATWVSPPLAPQGKSLGLLQSFNAGLEGITWMQDKEFMLCAERDYRGLIRLTLNENRPVVKMWRMDDAQIGKTDGGNVDFSGLDHTREGLFVIVRNAHAICRLAFVEDKPRKTQCWDFAEIEKDPRFAYENMIFGRAEGLSVRGDLFYLVLDNNNDARAVDPKDRRPLLFILRPSK